MRVASRSGGSIPIGGYQYAPSRSLPPSFRVAVARGGGPEQAAKPITEAETVLAIYTSGGFRPSVEPRLILAIWGDGRVVWSEDRLQGGSPYRAGQIDAKRLTALVSRLERDGVFADEKLSHANFRPGLAVHDNSGEIGQATVENAIMARAIRSGRQGRGHETRARAPGRPKPPGRPRRAARGIPALPTRLGRASREYVGLDPEREQADQRQAVARSGQGVLARTGGQGREDRTT